MRVEIESSPSVDGVKFEAGDLVTVAGLYEPIKNPDRRWWQFWKPRKVEGPQLTRYICAGRLQR